jgi:hypothetical protein
LRNKKTAFCKELKIDLFNYAKGIKDSLAMNDLLNKPGIPKLTEILLKKMEPIQFRKRNEKYRCKLWNSKTCG